MPKAFPGAYGWGAESIGGRGGTVIEVTNTNDSGAGSFRTALTTAGARIVVFRVAGLISLTASSTESTEQSRNETTTASKKSSGNGRASAIPLINFGKRIL